jgi:transposase-like protein
MEVKKGLHLFYVDRGALRGKLDVIMPFFIGAMARAALVKLACPHCGKVQARARKPLHERYRCRYCHKLFTREEGEKQERDRR